MRITVKGAVWFTHLPEPSRQRSQLLRIIQHLQRRLPGLTPARPGAANGLGHSEQKWPRAAAAAQKNGGPRRQQGYGGAWAGVDARVGR